VPELAGYGRRVLAWILDLLASWLVAAVIAAPWILADVAFDDETLNLILGVPLFTGALAVVVLWEPIFMRRHGDRNGQTPGKQAMGIRVVRDDGRPVTFATGLLRDFLFKTVLGGFSGGLFSLVDYLWPLWERENRALHDLVAGTHVVRT
jgi:uncharacterized RDD family membrane protein YckC